MAFGMTIRDLFEDVFDHSPLDPVEAVRRNMRPSRRRFYETAGVAATDEGFTLELDHRPVKTPARRPLAAPTRPLAEAIAAEWSAQGEFIEPARMLLTRLANTVIDGVSGARADVAADIAKYLASDLVFYRAAEPERLVARQAQHWDPVLAWARDVLGARFILAEGVTFVHQTEDALAAARTALPDDPWRLGALHAITTLTGSALIALMIAERAISLEAAWAAAHVDEDWNMELWGRDELALERRAIRFAEMQAAATVLTLTPHFSALRG
jgi:chaperone required for assembly of F1-ATPase